MRSPPTVSTPTRFASGDAVGEVRERAHVRELVRVTLAVGAGSRRVSSFVHGLTLESFSAASTFAFVYVNGPSRMISCGRPPPGTSL